MHLRWKPSQQGKRRFQESLSAPQSHASTGPVANTHTAPSPSSKWHVWCQVLKFNREQLDASRLISEALGVGANAVSFAGIKDKRALSCQICSVSVDMADVRVQQAIRFNPQQHKELESTVNACEAVQGHEDSSEGGSVSSEHIQRSEIMFLSALHSKLKTLVNLSLVNFFTRSVPLGTDCSLPEYAALLSVTNGISIGNICFRQDKSVRAGDLWGNQFTIRLRDVKSILTPSQPHINREYEEERKRIDKALELQLAARLKSLECVGVPNFFGSQRMGALYSHSRPSSRPLQTDRSAR
jgi:tRNA(Glu) U13 pseudouridine synthase TruD